MILKGGIPGVLVKTSGTYGITPAGIGLAGNASSPLLNDIDPGDTSTELLWALLPSLVASGTTQVTDQGGYALVGAANGTWVQPYRLFSMPQTGSPLVQDSTITTNVGTTVVGPTITLQPANTTVDEGDPATFTVTATGTAPLAYQWMRNGEDIADETGASYTLAPSALTDNGAEFSVMVSNEAGAVISTAAVLTVNLVGGTLIVEDGTGKPDAESYISVVDANVYHAGRSNTAWAALGTLAKEAALRRATDYMVQMYRWRWNGLRKLTTQALDWPRVNVPINDSGVLSYVDDDIVPVLVQRACADLALKASAGDLAPDVGRVVARDRIDVLEIVYQEGAAPWVRYRAVDNALAAYFKPGSGVTMTLQRS